MKNVLILTSLGPETLVCLRHAIAEFQAYPLSVTLFCPFPQTAGPGRRPADEAQPPLALPLPPDTALALQKFCRAYPFSIAQIKCLGEERLTWPAFRDLLVKEQVSAIVTCPPPVLPVSEEFWQQGQRMLTLSQRQLIILPAETIAHYQRQLQTEEILPDYEGERRVPPVYAPVSRLPERIFVTANLEPVDPADA